jgi:segregation and condensation protein B
MDDIKNIIESLLFVTEEPLTVDRIKRIVAQAETKEIRTALDDLSAEYDERGGGFHLVRVAGGYQIRTRPEYTRWIKQLIQPKPLRLSKPALETLAIIAYKQPVIRSDVEHIRGVDCGGVLRVLLERKFIRVLGRREIPGRPLIYATTKKFLEVFDLKDLRDLPTPKEIEELGASASERRAELALQEGQSPENDADGSPQIETGSGNPEDAPDLTVVEEPAEILPTDQDTLEPLGNEPPRDNLRAPAPLSEQTEEPDTSVEEPKPPVQEQGSPVEETDASGDKL